MPIIKELHTIDNAHILVWQDREDLEYFLERTQLSDEEHVLLEKYSVERRKKDLLIARHLIQQCVPNAAVTYHPNGKPYLKGQEFNISISHSKDLVAVILHKEKIVGIDIEYISPRVEKVKKRFLSDQELNAANTTALLTLYWSAKETLFKVDAKQGLDFSTEISLIPSHSETLRGNIRNGEDITVHYSEENEWIMTYAIH